jgi:hypothetical protein
MVVSPPTKIHTALAMGPMGFGTAAVIGAKLADPTAPCLAVVGDGGFLMQVAEVSTAAQDKIGAIWVVLADHDLTMVSQGMAIVAKDPTYEDYYQIGWTDLAAVAPTARTSRGFHVYARTRLGEHWEKFADGEYIANSKHFAVVPPSRHPSGTTYRWLNGPPIGPSEFPILDPRKAGLLPDRNRKGDRPERAKWHTRHYLPSWSSSASASTPAETGVTVLPDAIRECVLRNLPDRAGQRNARLLQLARALRDHVADDTQAGLLHDAVVAWWRLVLPVIGTKDFATSLSDFRRAWSAVRVPMSISRPVMALSLGAAVATDADPRARLIAACRALAAETGGVFYLGGRTAASTIGLPHRSTARLLKSLVQCGELELVRAGRPSNTRRRASIYLCATP